MSTVESGPVIEYYQSVVSRLTPCFAKKNIFNEPNCKNLLSIPLAETISQINYRGKLHQVVGLGLQGFVNEEGFIKPPQEPDVIEIYFPLFGMSKLVRNDEIKTMIGCFTDFGLFKNRTKLYVVSGKGNVDVIAVISNESPIQILIPPVVIEPGVAHEISWKSKKDHATPLTSIQPLFLVMKLKPIFLTVNTF